MATLPLTTLTVRTRSSEDRTSAGTRKEGTTRSPDGFDPGSPLGNKRPRSSDSASSVPATLFPRFGELPPELRLLVLESVEVQDADAVRYVNREGRRFFDSSDTLREKARLAAEVQALVERLADMRQATPPLAEIRLLVDLMRAGQLQAFGRSVAHRLHAMSQTAITRSYAATCSLAGAVIARGLGDKSLISDIGSAISNMPIVTSHQGTPNGRSVFRANALGRVLAEIPDDEASQGGYAGLRRDLDYHAAAMGARGVDAEPPRYDLATLRSALAAGDSGFHAAWAATAQWVADLRVHAAAAPASTDPIPELNAAQRGDVMRTLTSALAAGANAAWSPTAAKVAGRLLGSGQLLPAQSDAIAEAIDKPAVPTTSQDLRRATRTRRMCEALGNLCSPDHPDRYEPLLRMVRKPVHTSSLNLMRDRSRGRYDFDLLLAAPNLPPPVVDEIRRIRSGLR